METLGRAACMNREGPNPALVLPGAPPSSISWALQYVVPPEVLKG